MNSAVHFALN